MWIKLIAVVLAAALAVTVALYLLGGRTYVHSVSRVVAAPPEFVFNYLVEPELLKQWISGLVESTALTDGGVRPGARSREIIEERGRRSEMYTEVTAVEPAALLELDLTSNLMRAQATYRLEPAARGTNVRHVLAIRYRGLTRLLAPFVGSIAQRKLEADLTQLVRAVEEGAGRSEARR